MRILKKEYYDLLSFTFGLQHEMRQSKHSVSTKTKQLMVQSVRDLNQKRKMLNKLFYSLRCWGDIEVRRQRIGAMLMLMMMVGDDDVDDDGW